MANNSVLSGTKRWEVSTLLILLLAALVNSRGPTRRAGRHHAHLVARDSVNGDHRRTRDEAGSVPVYEACSAPGSFSLTFDDGPSEYSAALDATLGRNNAKASFYINGNNAGCIYDYADLLLQRFKDGHLIASHTWSHVHLNQGSYEAISYQLQLLEDAMIKILGVKPLYFRPPYGEYNDLTLQVLHDRGYKGMILWSQDSQDSAEAPPSASQMVSDYRTYPDGTIVLHHETQALSVDQVIPLALPILQEKRLNLITSPECLDLGSNPSDWYVAVQQPGSRDDSWTCDGTPTSESYDH